MTQPCDRVVSEHGENVLRARNRGEEPADLVPGVLERFNIPLSPTSHVFRAGHRIRIQVTGSNFPRFERNLHRGSMSPPADSEGFLSAVQTVVFDEHTRTRLVLPVVNNGLY